MCASRVGGIWLSYLVAPLAHRNTAACASARWPCSGELLLLVVGRQVGRSSRWKVLRTAPVVRGTRHTCRSWRGLLCVFCSVGRGQRGRRPEKLQRYPKKIGERIKFGSKAWQEQKLHAAGSGYYMKGEDTRRTAEPKTVGESDRSLQC